MSWKRRNSLLVTLLVKLAHGRNGATGTVSFNQMHADQLRVGLFVTVLEFTHSLRDRKEDFGTRVWGEEGVLRSQNSRTLAFPLSLGQRTNHKPLNINEVKVLQLL